MITYRLKSAIIEVTPSKSDFRYSDIQIVEQVKALKKELERYDRNTEQWSFLVREIRILRKRLHKIPNPQDRPKRKGYDFKVTLTGWSKYQTTFYADIYENQTLMLEIRRLVKAYRQQAIQQDRRSRKVFPATDLLLDYPVQVSRRIKKGDGRVYTQPEQLLKIHIQRNLKSLYADKVPQKNNNYLGVEIEFCAPITEEAMAVKLFQAGFQKYVQLKKDGSLRPQKGETGFELAMLLRESSYKKDLKRVTDFIASVKGTAVDRRCGLHVHFDMRKRDKNVVFNNLVSCQAILLKLVDPRRYDNEFCRLVRSKKFPIAFNNTREERYKTINAAAYYRHKTLEVRMHEGTVSFDDMINWIDVLLKIVNYKKKLKNDIQQLPVFKKRFKVPAKIYQAVVDKSCFWQITQGETVQRNNEIEQQTQRERIPLAERIRQAEEMLLMPTPEPAFPIAMPTPTPDTGMRVRGQETANPADWGIALNPADEEMFEDQLIDNQ